MEITLIMVHGQPPLETEIEGELTELEVEFEALRTQVVFIEARIAAIGGMIAGLYFRHEQVVTRWFLNWPSQRSRH